MVRDGRLEPAIKAPGKRGALLFRREDVFAAAVQAHYLESVRTGGDRIKRRRAS